MATGIESQEKGDRLLSYVERDILGEVATKDPPFSQRAQALLAIDEGTTQAAADHANHTMFWNSLHYAGGGEPDGKLAEAIGEASGSFGEFKEALSKATTTLLGVGWTWLCVDGEGKLLITTTANQDNPVSQGLLPLLGLDVWEHAYYLKYENRRADYVAAWWNVVSWGFVAANFTASRVELGARDVAADVTKRAEDTWAKIDSVFSKSSDD